MTKNTQDKQTISAKSIFGEYSQAENRVTAALLHILYLGGNPIIQRVFGDAIDIPSNDIKIITQSDQKDSVPDGEISCDCSYKIYIESKIKKNAISNKQLMEHSKLQDPSINQYLCYITPDSNIPQVLSNLSVAWLSWEWVAQVLLGAIAEGIVSTVLKYLIEQFCILVKHLVYKDKSTKFDFTNPDVFISEGKNRVIIVGGSWGESVAIKYNFYACQPNRSFLEAKYITFCYNNRILYLFEIVDVKDSVDLRSEALPSNYFIEKEPGYKGDYRKLFRLKFVRKFEPQIINNKVDKNGNLCAFVYKQNYTTYEKIIKAKYTTEL